MHADFEMLLQRSIGIAQRVLAAEPGFLPYAALLGQDDSVQIVHCDDPRVSAADGSLIEQLEALADSQRLRSRAVIYDALTGGPGDFDAGDAIAASLSHANGLRQLALMPYERDDTGIRFGTLEIQLT